jgi:hypothetical protein
MCVCVCIYIYIYIYIYIHTHTHEQTSSVVNIEKNSPKSWYSSTKLTASHLTIRNIICRPENLIGHLLHYKYNFSSANLNICTIVAAIIEHF